MDDSLAVPPASCGLALLSSLITHTFTRNVPFRSSHPNPVPFSHQIAHDFNFTDQERDTKLGGHISVAFFLLGLPACLLIGALTDVVPRKKLLVWTVVLGQGPCLLTLLVTQYWQLFALRTLTGIAVGGALPLIFSIAGDLFPSTSRSYASSMVGLCMHLGGMCGQGAAGYLGPTFGWRVPFAVVAVPGLLVALAVAAFAVEPRRGGSEGGASGAAVAASASEASAAAGSSSSASSSSLPSSSAAAGTGAGAGAASFTGFARGALKKAGAVLRRPTNVMGFLQGIPGCVPWSVINVFMNDYLAVDKGLGVHLATTVMMAFGIGAMVGVALGGVVGQRLYNAKPWLMTTAMGAFAISGIFPWLYLTAADDYSAEAGQMTGKIAVAALAGVLVAMTGVNVRAMIVNVNAPYERGTAFAIFNLTDDLGKGFGPVMSSFLIARVGRELAFIIAFWFWLPCGLLCVACGWTMQGDEEATRREMAELAAAGGGTAAAAAGDDGRGDEYTALLAGEDVDKLV